MKYQFFDIPARDSTSATATLNRFLAEHHVLSVDRQLIVDGQASYWAVSVSWVDGETAATAAASDGKGRKPKVDYKEVLSPPDFAVFAAMRDLRKQLAEAEGVPAYALFTNEQLAEMARLRAQSAEALAGIDGVGKGRVERYGAPFLKVLKDNPRKPDAPPQAPQSGNAAHPN